MAARFASLLRDLYVSAEYRGTNSGFKVHLPKGVRFNSIFYQSGAKQVQETAALVVFDILVLAAHRNLVERSWLTTI